MATLYDILQSRFGRKSKGLLEAAESPLAALLQNRANDPGFSISQQQFQRMQQPAARMPGMTPLSASMGFEQPPELQPQSVPPQMSPEMQQIMAERSRAALEGALGVKLPESQEEFGALPEPIRKVLQERFSPERQRRIQQMREETPDVLAQRAYQQYWGNPTSKLGKVGTAIAQIASGALGAPQPDFGGMALKQYQLQQQALRDEESSDSREVIGAVNAWAKNQQTDAKTQQTDKDRELKSTEILLKNQVQETANAIKFYEARYKAGDLTAAAELKNAQRKLIDITANPTFQALKLSKGAGAYMGLKSMVGEDAAEEYAKAFSAQVADEKQKEASPGGTSTSVSQRLVDMPVPGGGTQPTKVDFVNQRYSAPKPAQGRAGAFAENATGVMALPEPMRPPSPQQQPRSAPRSAAPVSQLPAPLAAGAGMAPPPAQPKGRLLGDDIVSESTAGSGLKAYYFAPPGMENSLGFTKKTAKQEQDERVILSEMSKSAMLLDMTQDAALKGKLKDSVGLGNNIADLWGGPGTTLGIEKAIPGGKDLTYKQLLYRMGGDQVASYLQKMSGAQVSHQEYLRLRELFPKLTDNPDSFASMAYFNTVAPSVLKHLEDRGILQPGMVGNMGLGQLFMDKTNEYMRNLKAAQAGNKEAAARLKDLRDVNKLAVEAVQRAYPKDMGKEIEIRQPRGGVVRVRVPTPIDDIINKATQDEAKEKARKALRGVVR
jgi:hypothetical protein